jgi:hypothetical protein
MLPPMRYPKNSRALASIPFASAAWQITVVRWLPIPILRKLEHLLPKSRAFLGRLVNEIKKDLASEPRNSLSVAV